MVIGISDLVLDYKQRGKAVLICRVDNGEEVFEYMSSYRDKIAKVAALLRGRGPNFALTGAGVSTESGIPDFRTPGMGRWRRVDPIKTATINALRENPAAFYKNNFDLFSMCSEAEPNSAHYGLAELEKNDYLHGVITQNIDGLHQRAGTETIWEVHGHLRTCSCQECETTFSFDFLTGQYNSGVNPPLCQKCEGVLRPDVVLFGDAMSVDFQHALMALEECQLLIAAGTSLTVFPVAGLPARAKRLVIINKGSTPWDDRADVVLRESLGKVLTDIVDELGK